MSDDSYSKIAKLFGMPEREADGFVQVYPTMQLLVNALGILARRAAGAIDLTEQEVNDITGWRIFFRVNPDSAIIRLCAEKMPEQPEAQEPALTPGVTVGLDLTKES